jgi:LuxR family transcriptional regulator, maltose regulon positive regulatory protein
VNISQPLKVDILGPGRAPARPRVARRTGRWPNPVRHSRRDDVGAGLPESQNTERQDFPGGYRTARGGSRLAERDPQETPVALAPARGASVPRAYLLWTAFLLLEVIAADALGDPDAATLALVRDRGPVEPDRVLFPALIRVALGLSGRRAGHGPAEAVRVFELAGLLGEVKGSAPPSAEPPWPGEPLTQSETRVLRYLPTHLGVPEIAAELYLSANTVKTHLRHLYRKLGAHSRQEAVQRARAIGLLTASSRRT